MLILQKDAGVLRTGGRGCQLRRPTVSCKLPLAPPVPSLARMDVCGGMVKLVYTEALKASSTQGECGFDSHSRYHNISFIINTLQDIHFPCTLTGFLADVVVRPFPYLYTRNGIRP